MNHSICSHECTFTNAEIAPVFRIRKTREVICKHIRKHTNIHAHGQNSEQGGAAK